MIQTNRRQFVGIVLSSAVLPTANRLAGAEKQSPYARANTDWLAKSRYLDNGLQWFGWTCLEDRAWVHTKLDTPIRAPLYTDEQVIRYVRTCNQHLAPMTFNVGIYQDGKMAEASVEQLHRLNRVIGLLEARPQRYTK